MGFGKRVCELLAVIASLLLIGALVWYLSSGFGDRGYEKEGTLVWEEMDGPSVEEEVCPAFVTDPVSMMYGQQEIQKERKRSMNHTVYLKLSQNHGADPQGRCPKGRGPGFTATTRM